MGYIARMPKMGMSMDEGVVVEWNLDEGDAAEAGDAVAVVESEKASNDVEAREDGVLRRILVPEGTAVEPGDPIGIFAGEDENISEFETEVSEFETDVSEVEAEVDDSADAGTTAADSPGAPSQTGMSGSAEASESSATTDDVQATPGARQLADETGVNLAAVDGSGPQGVVVEADVEDASASESEPAEADVRATPGARHAAEERGVSLAGVDGTGPQGVITREDVEEHQAGTESEGATRTVVETRELSGIQQSVSERLSESARNAVHVTLNRSIDTAALRSVQAAASERDVDGSLTDLLVKAVGRTLSEHSEFNAIYEDGEYQLIGEINVGVAVDVEDGLVTPVVPSVPEKSTEDVNAERTTLTNRALSGEFDMGDLSGGTFTISNLGMFGVDHFDPVINPPQIAILGVGRTRDDGTMTLSLSFDHRVVNGADAARFLDALCDALTDRATLAGFFAADVDADALDDREIRVETADGFSGRYRTAHGNVGFDEPEDVGGSGSAPSPVDHLLGALGSCLSLSVRQMAERDGVELGRVACDISGTPTNGPLQDVRVELELDTAADTETVETVVQKAERACYVARSLSEDLPVSLEWTRA